MDLIIGIILSIIITGLLLEIRTGLISDFIIDMFTNFMGK